MGCVKSTNSKAIPKANKPQVLCKGNFRMKPVKQSIYRFIKIDLSKNLLYAKRVQQQLERKTQIEVSLLSLRNNSETTCYSIN